LRVSKVDILKDIACFLCALVCHIVLSDNVTVAMRIPAMVNNLSGLPIMQSPVSPEYQLGGAARDHVGRRARPRPRNDPWHHRGVNHA